jgi:hypothetical protein
VDQAAVGVRVKSGWAVAALVAGPAAAPVLVDVRRVELADPASAGAIQPFHAGLENPGRAGIEQTARLVRGVRRFARRSLDRLLKDYAARAGRLAAVGVVVGSQTDPATIANDHIRAHAEEGGLFRTVVVDAAERHGIRVQVVTEKVLFEEASAELRRPAAALKKALADLGPGAGHGWRAEEKSAALAAWMHLA